MCVCVCVYVCGGKGLRRQRSYRSHLSAITYRLEQIKVSIGCLWSESRQVKIVLCQSMMDDCILEHGELGMVLG